MKQDTLVPTNELNRPLVVDLDGTLIHTDLLLEAILLLFRKNPFYIFLCLIWILKGRAYLKSKVFQKIHIPYELLPFNHNLIEFLKSEHDTGRKLILATASPSTAAAEIVRIHSFFDEVFGSNEAINLKGHKKRLLLDQHFGKGNYDYIGNSNSDLKIFESAHFTYLVNPSKALENRTRKISDLKHVWKTESSMWNIFRSIRVYQWVKNLLIFVPLVTSHTFNSLNHISNALIGFIAFCLLASAGYIINDLFDLNSDRTHPQKSNRPFASGKVSISTAFIVFIFLFTAGFLAAFTLGYVFFIIALIYLTTSVNYSLFLKKIALYDVFILALLYSIRIFAGAVAIKVQLSFWLIAFSTFIFLSLAFIKRFSELIQISNEQNLSKRGRQYHKGDLSILQTMGIASGFLSVVVFSLYINSSEVVKLYSQPKILWAISLVFLFWISRIWLLTIRGEVDEDPIVFAIKDKTSYFTFLFIFVIILISI
jgi:4-hydroxybenzoate polyprenyltransferase